MSEIQQITFSSNTLTDILIERAESAVEWLDKYKDSSCRHTVAVVEGTRDLNQDLYVMLVNLSK